MIPITGGIVLQAFILALYVGVSISVIRLGFDMWAPLFNGFIAGLFVGDINIGMQVGAYCALMSIGFYTYGGATIPDYNIGAIFGAFVAKQSMNAGMTLDAAVTNALTVGTAIALLMSLFDVFGRAGTVVFQHAGDRALAKNKIKSFEHMHLAGTLSWGLGRFIPVFIGMLFINQYQLVADFIAKLGWLQHGLSIAGAALPAVGFAMLLSFMDIKGYWPYLLIGFVLFAYLKVPTMGLAIAGCALAGIYMMRKHSEAEIQASVQPASAEGGN
jgi:PTS system mannose-specific IIC component